MNRRTAASVQSGLVREHVVAHEMRHSLLEGSRGVEARQELPRHLARRPLRGRGNGRRPAYRACRCRGAARPAGRAAGSARRRRSGGCGPTDPRPRSCSGSCRAGGPGPARSRPAGPSLGHQPQADRRPARASSLGSSAQTARPERWPRQFRVAPDRRERLRLRPRTPSVAASLTARTMRRASSRNRSSGSPTARRSRRARSARPPCGST